MYRKSLNNPSSECDSLQRQLDAAVAYAWRQPVLTRQRSDADWRVTDLTKRLNSCKAEASRQAAEDRRESSQQAADRRAAAAAACDRIQRDLDAAIAYAWRQPVLSRQRSDADWKVTELRTALLKCRLQVSAAAEEQTSSSPLVQSAAASTARRADYDNLREQKLVRVLTAQVEASCTMRDIRVCIRAQKQALQKNRISASAAHVLRNKLAAKAKRIRAATGYDRLTRPQKVNLVQLLRMLRAGRISAAQAAASAAVAAPEIKTDWVEHATVASEEPQVASEATSAAPELATAAEAAASSDVTDTTASSSGASFVAASDAVVAAEYDTSGETSSDPASTSSEGFEADAADAESSIAEPAKSNTLLYAVGALAGVGVWYFFFRPTSTTIVVK